MRVLAGKVRTMVEGAAPVEAIAIDGTTIVAVGARAQVIARAGDTAVEEVGAVVPGFIDAHHHMCMALLLDHTVSCRIEDAPSHEALVARLRAAARHLPPGAWVVGIGYDAKRLGDRHPTREQLDAVSNDHPVLLIAYSHHEAVANSRALALCGIDRHSPDPANGIVERDKRGEPTGRLIEAAMGRAERLSRESLVELHAEDWIASIPAYEQRLFASGLTRIHDPIVAPAFVELYARAKREGKLRVSLVMSPLAAGGFMEADPLDGPSTGEGTTELRVGPVKIVFDGAERCAMCLSWRQLVTSGFRTIAHAVRHRSMTALRSANAVPFMRRGTKFHRGLLFYDRDQARAVTRDATARGFDLMIHAIGNEAVATALDAIELAGRRPRGGPPRIEHATVVDDLLVKRAADLGVILSTQATFLELPDFAALPPVSGLSIMPLRSMLEAGARVALSADYPVTPFEPLYGMRCAVERRMADGRIHDPEESLFPEEALAGYTRVAASATGTLDAGTLEVGKRADLVILSEDPCAGKALARTRVLETILGGTSVYRA